MLSGCSEDEATAPERNTPPEISFTFNKLAVPKGIDVDLTVSVSDEDDDPLTVTWEITRGWLNPDDQGKPQMTWTPPTEVGLDTVRVRVSDGKASRTIEETIAVGTRWMSGIPAEPWTAALSPVILVGEQDPPQFAVPDLATLRIGEGVEVLVREGLIWYVQGTLETRGTQAEPVVITPNHRSPSEGFWKGIQVEEGHEEPPGSVDMEYTTIKYAQHNIQIASLAFKPSARLKGCRLLFSQNEGILHKSRGALIVEDSAIKDNLGSGIVVQKPTSLPDSIRIQGSAIQHNGGAGIVIDVKDSTKTIPISIIGNEITWNTSYGIHVIRAAYPAIHQNALHTNDVGKTNPLNRLNLVLEPGFIGAVDTVYAEDNYWLANEAVYIDQTIYDQMDNPSEINARVKFWPWLSAWP
jgi:hypothetical protein